MFCPYCGTRLDADINFCPNCGHKLNMAVIAPDLYREYMEKKKKAEEENAAQSVPEKEQDESVQPVISTIEDAVKSNITVGELLEAAGEIPPGTAEQDSEHSMEERVDHSVEEETEQRTGDSVEEEPEQKPGDSAEEETEQRLSHPTEEISEQPSEEAAFIADETNASEDASPVSIEKENVSEADAVSAREEADAVSASKEEKTVSVPAKETVMEEIAAVVSGENIASTESESSEESEPEDVIPAPKEEEPEREGTIPAASESGEESEPEDAAPAPKEEESEEAEPERKDSTSAALKEETQVKQQETQENILGSAEESGVSENRNLNSPTELENDNEEEDDILVVPADRTQPFRKEALSEMNAPAADVPGGKTIDLGGLQTIFAEADQSKPGSIAENGMDDKNASDSKNGNADALYNKIGDEKVSEEGLNAGNASEARMDDEKVSEARMDDENISENEINNENSSESKAASEDISDDGMTKEDKEDIPEDRTKVIEVPDEKTIVIPDIGAEKDNAMREPGVREDSDQSSDSQEEAEGQKISRQEDEYRNPHPNTSRHDKEQAEYSDYYRDEERGRHRKETARPDTDHFAIEDDEEYRRHMKRKTEARRRQRNHRVILGVIFAVIGVLAVILILSIVHPEALPFFRNTSDSSGEDSVTGASSEAYISGQIKATPSAAAREDSIISDSSFTPSEAEEATPSPSATATPSPTATAAPSATAAAPSATAAPTATATPTPTAAPAASSGYIFANSNTTALTDAQLSGLSKSQLRLARNEIFARHGRKFNDKELQNYFNGKSWYKGTMSPETFDAQYNTILNSVEKANVLKIKAYERK